MTSFFMYKIFGRKVSKTTIISTIIPSIFLFSFVFLPFSPLIVVSDEESVPIVLVVDELPQIPQNILPMAKSVIDPRVIVPVKKAAIVVIKKAITVANSRLLIPVIEVNATIINMGFTPEGAMAIPDNRIDVGWFSPGTLPGNIGSAVIGGHNRWDGGSGVFDRLNLLRTGDVMSVIDAKGITTNFIVRDIRTYDAAADGTDIFSSDNGIHLNLITCSGIWDFSKKSYTDRLVVFADKQIE